MGLGYFWPDLAKTNLTAPLHYVVVVHVLVVVVVVVLVSGHPHCASLGDARYCLTVSTNSDHPRTY